MKNKKTIIVILLVVLIAGAIVTLVKGFNFDLLYAGTKQVSLYINKEFEVNDVKQITNEVLGKQQVVIRKIEVYGDAISIRTREMTDEQKNQLVEKVNEKYGTELKAEDINIENIDGVKIIDILKPCIAPIILATILVLIYVAIRYYKLGFMKVILKSIAILAIAEAELFSVIAITRIPLGTLTISLVLIVYAIAIYGMTVKFEKDLQKYKEENEKEE